MSSSQGRDTFPSLKSTTKETRFVSFTSAPKAEVFELVHHVFDLDDPEVPPYHALSYVWGDPNVTEVIKLNGLAFQVTKNLLLALRMLLDRYGNVSGSDKTYFWIDAICIDQRDNNEKNHQVAMMGRIYSGAELVVMWTGEEDLEDSDALSLLQEWTVPGASAVSAIIQQRAPTAIATQITDFNRLRHDFLRDRYTLVRASGTLGTARLRSLARFLSRPYWTRVWILQEMVLARKGDVICGSKTLPLISFISALDSLLEVIKTDALPDHERLPGMSFCTHTHAAIWQARQISALIRRGMEAEPQDRIDIETFPFRALIGLSLQTPELDFMLSNASYLEASDARDRIFALHGLVHDTRGFPEPDYNLKLHEVFSSVIIANYKSLQTFRLLAWAGTGFSDEAMKRTKHLPSWVPDFANLDYNCIQVQKIALSFRASGGTLPIAAFLEDNAELVARGVISDQVRACCTDFVPDNTSQSLWDMARFTTDNMTEVENLQPHGLDWVNALFYNFYNLGCRMGVTKDEQNRAALKRCFIQLLIEAATQTGDGELDLLLDILPPDHFQTLYLSLLEADLNGTGAANPDLVLDALFSYLNGSAEYSKEHYNDLTGFSGSLKFRERMKSRTRLIMTRDGYIGFAPKHTRPMDRVCIVYGCPTPLIIRPHADKYELVGWAHVAGMMDGEIVQEMKTCAASSSAGAEAEGLTAPRKLLEQDIHFF